MGSAFLIRYLLLLIFVPLLAVIFFAVLIATITLTKMYIRRLRDKRAKQAAQQAKTGPDGESYPLSGRGICHDCQRAFEKVYYLPTGRSICPECYAKLCRTQAGGG